MTRPVRLRASERRAIRRDTWRVPCPACGRRALTATTSALPVSLSCAKCHVVSELPAVPNFDALPCPGGHRTVLVGYTLGLDLGGPR